MVKLIPGKRGSGKTKLLIDAIHEAGKTSKGNVVVIQIGSSLNSSVNHKIRLINIEDYQIKGYDALYGFISGILASDYDCTDIFVDGLLKIVGRDFDMVAKVFDKLAENDNSTCITFTFSADISELPDTIKKYL